MYNSSKKERCEASWNTMNQRATVMASVAD